MKPRISIFMDSNERGSGRDTDLALACGSDPAFDLAGFAELAVDMRFISGPADGNLRNLNVELKEISDFWSSKSSGHLGQQILEMISKGEPGFVAVFGSLQEVLDQVPKYSGKNGWSMKRTQFDIDSDINTCRAFSADAMACNVPVHFLSSDRPQAFKWVLSYAKHILAGPSLASWLPRFDVDARSYGILCSIPGVGDAAAKGLLAAYGGIAQIVNDAKFNPDGLATTKINGKALGKAKAAKIVLAVGCEIPEAWA